MENDQRVKQLMNTYTARSGATHVCCGQLLSEFRQEGTSEACLQWVFLIDTICALANICMNMRLLNAVNIL